MEILFDDIERKNVILVIGENRYSLPIKFDLAAALALENKCGSLENVSKILNLETSLWIFRHMLNTSICRYNAANSVKLPKIEHIEELISSDSLGSAIVVRTIILRIVFDDFTPDENEQPSGSKKKEEETPETT